MTLISFYMHVILGKGNFIKDKSPPFGMGFYLFFTELKNDGLGNEMLAFGKKNAICGVVSRTIDFGFYCVARIFKVARAFFLELRLSPLSIIRSA